MTLLFIAVLPINSKLSLLCIFYYVYQYTQSSYSFTMNFPPLTNQFLYSLICTTFRMPIYSLNVRLCTGSRMKYMEYFGVVKEMQVLW